MCTGSAEPLSRPGRSLLMVVGVVVLLIAAIAFANRGGGDGGSHTSGDSGSPGAAPTAPTGDKPVRASDDTTGIPSGFAHTKQGAQSAAANYAVALGGDGMSSSRSQRHAIVHARSSPRQGRLRCARRVTRTTSTQLSQQKIGPEERRNRSGRHDVRLAHSPGWHEGHRLHRRSAKVDVWCTGLFGMAGKDSTNPVTSDWFTDAVRHVAWTHGDWKVTGFAQKDGPAPVRGDNKASTR